MKYCLVSQTSVLKPGLVFIDGNHRKEPVIKYFSQMAELSDSKTVIIIDDINYSKEMAEAWEEIKLHQKVSVSVDIFRMGFYFSGKELIIITMQSDINKN
jgi:hypothetical protein